MAFCFEAFTVYDTLYSKMNAYDVAPRAYIRGSKNESAQNTEDRARPVEQKRYVLVELKSHERRA